MGKSFFSVSAAPGLMIRSIPGKEGVYVTLDISKSERRLLIQNRRSDDVQGFVILNPSALGDFADSGGKPSSEKGTTVRPDPDSPEHALILFGPKNQIKRRFGRDEIAWAVQAFDCLATAKHAFDLMMGENGEAVIEEVEDILDEHDPPASAEPAQLARAS